MEEPVRRTYVVDKMHKPHITRDDRLRWVDGMELKTHRRVVVPQKHTVAESFDKHVMVRH